MAGDDQRTTARRGEPTGRSRPRLLFGESDERLVALARAGDDQAFAAIVERYRAPLLRYCHSFVSPAAAEDALQQTFINAYAALSRDSARAPVSLRPWLYRVAHNAALNLARDPHAGLDPLPESLDGVERPDEVFQRRERLRRVVGAVCALPPRQRHVIVRHALEGDSHEQIASELGVSAGSVRQLAHRARRTIRDAAAGLLPTPLTRWLPWGADVVEAVPAAGGGAVLAKVAVAVLVAGGAGGGAAQVVKHHGERHEPRVATVARAPEPGGASRLAPVAGAAAPPGGRGSEPQARGDSSGRGSGSSSGHGSSGSGSSGSGSSGSGSSGSGSSGSGSLGSSGSGSSGSGSSGSDSSGSGSSGSGASGDGLRSGTSGSATSVSGA
jgi:RNA polymerase sigma factor (sigma-70 family)